MQFNPEKIRNVLVLAPDKHMGDLVLSLSAIKALKNLFKSNNFYLVIDDAYTEIVESLGEIGNIIPFPRAALKNRSFTKKTRMFFNFLGKLRKASPDVTIDLHGVVASSTMTLLSWAPLRIGRSTAKRPYFYNYRVDIVHNRHKFYTFTDIAHAAGVQEGISPFSANPSESSRQSLKRILDREKISFQKPYACIHPGAGQKYKEWTEEGFAYISDWLSSKGFHTVLIGNSTESEKIERITSMTKRNIYNLAGKLSLGELIALFEKSSLYIGNDSGPMHLAAAAGTPVVALFGPADENRWAPLSDKAVVLRGEDRCQKCTGKDCDHDFKCVTTINPRDVKTAVVKLTGGTEN